MTEVATWLPGARVLVTGGAGLIGRATVRAFAEAGATVTVFDSVESDVIGAREFVVGDICDEASVRSAVANQDVVVHLAGVPGLEFESATTTYRVNTVGTFTVLLAAAEAGIARIVYASSINAAGWPLNPRGVMPPSFPFDEDSEPEVGDWYSLSKAANEAAAAMIRDRFSVAVTGLRFPLVRDIVGDPATFALHLDNLMRSDRRRAACEGWSYLDTSDAGRACVLAASAARSDGPGILVAAPHTYVTESTAHALALEAPEVPRTPVAGREVPINLNRARTFLGFEARVVLDDVAPECLVSLADYPEVS
jgi:nucleoside-diphosphate-sugar epimerase